MPQVTVLLRQPDNDEITEVTIDEMDRLFIDPRIGQHILYSERLVVAMFHSTYVMGVYPSGDDEEKSFKLEVRDGEVTRSY